MSRPVRCLPPLARTVLSFRGPDAARYLNGQLTQDVRNLQETALPSCVTDAKGKLQFFVHVFRGPDDSIWVEGPAGEAEELEARLTRYLIADDVEVENLSAAWTLTHLLDSTEPQLPGTGFVRKAARIGESGFDVWLPAGTGFPCTPLAPDEVEARRIAAAAPAWGVELVAGMLPPEAGLDRSAISYHKGCYIGQEVLSRLKTAGKLNRRLASFLVPAGTPAGTTLHLEPLPKPAGQLTSVSPVEASPGWSAALGYLGKAAFEAPELGIGEGVGIAKVQPLP